MAAVRRFIVPFTVPPLNGTTDLCQGAKSRLFFSLALSLSPFPCALLPFLYVKSSRVAKNREESTRFEREKREEKSTEKEERKGPLERISRCSRGELGTSRVSTWRHSLSLSRAGDFAPGFRVSIE